jgi:hypothetical protein
MYLQRRSFLRKAPALKAVPRFFVVVQVFNTVSVLVDIPLLQEAIKLKTRQAEELASLVVGKCAGPVPFDDQSLKGFPAWILMLSEIVRKLYRYLHTRIIRLPYEMLNPRKRTNLLIGDLSAA